MLYLSTLPPCEMLLYLLGLAFNAVFGTFCGLAFGLVFVLSRDKPLLKSTITHCFDQATTILFNSPLLIGPLAAMSISVRQLVASTVEWMQPKEGSVGTAKLVNGNVMCIPFQYRRGKWKLHVSCDTSKENSEDRWTADGVSLEHCPMLPFTITARELGVENVAHVMEEEVDI